MSIAVSMHRPVSAIARGHNAFWTAIVTDDKDNTVTFFTEDREQAEAIAAAFATKPETVDD